MHTEKMTVNWGSPTYVKQYRQALATEMRTLLAQVEHEQRSFTTEEDLRHAEIAAELTATSKALARIDPGGLPDLLRDVTTLATPPALAGRAASAAGQSLGDRVIHHPSYGVLRQRGGAFDLELRDITGSVCGPTLVPMSPPPTTAVPGAQFIAPLRPTQLLVHRPEGTVVCDYPEFSARTGSTGVVAPAGAKPNVGVVVAFVPAKFSKLAGHCLVADEYLDDSPEAVAAAINTELMIDLANKLDSEVLIGDGTGQRMLGLVPASAAPDHAMTAGQSPWEAIMTAAGLVHAASGCYADGVVMNHLTATQCAAVTATTSGAFLMPPALGPQPAWCGGLRLAIAPDMANGQALVGSFTYGAELISKKGVQVQRDSGGAHFLSNITAIVIEVRTALAIMRKHAFNLVTGLPSV